MIIGKKQKNIMKLAYLTYNFTQSVKNTQEVLLQKDYKLFMFFKKNI